VFSPLTEEQLREIARLMVAQVNEAIEEKGIVLRPAPEVYDWLIESTCRDRSYGARPLRRAIQKHIEDALSERVIRGEMLGVGDVEIRLEDGKLIFKEMEVLNSLKD
jgi:ATP-dependent Clp protease ATP-binding subunit ClpC